ncbi:DUF2971 domain-containing protein [Arcobacter sp. KX21116]|uniref:DUF2971 domain-containing protein n=1 Tax=Arcobacter iocasae TaxID=2906515 RepID=UPI0035D3F0E6
MFNKVIDNDRILCLSENGTNNLMWGHYANSHKGFIIEFDTRYLKEPIRIKYTKEIQSLKLMTYIEYYFTKNKILGKQIGKEIMEALGCKLYDWEYEEEYRIILSNEPRKNLLVCDKENYSIIRYPNKPIVKSIIFGCRMPKEVRQYIIDKIPYQVKFKEVIELKSKLKIVDYKGTDLYIK